MNIHWNASAIHAFIGAAIVAPSAVGYVAFGTSPWWLWLSVAAATIFGIYREATADLTQLPLPDFSIMTPGKWIQAAGWGLGALTVAIVVVLTG